jgi:hypothetical protein
VRLTTRQEDGKQVRVVSWSNDSETDLALFFALGITVTICATSCLVAESTDGLIRTISIVVGVISGLYFCAFAVPTIVFGLGIYVVLGLFARRPSSMQQASWYISAALIGGLLGLDSYISGPAAIVVAPALLLVAIAARIRLPSRYARGRTRSIPLGITAAAGALLTSMTIFFN